MCEHRRYAEQLLDILIAGGQLAPGGKIESSVRASVCVFTCEPMVESLKEHVQVSVWCKPFIFSLTWLVMIWVWPGDDQVSSAAVQVPSEKSARGDGENTQISEGI